MKYIRVKVNGDYIKLKDTLLFIILAVTYDVPNEYIPNPGYMCTQHECNWCEYEKDVEWGFYKQYGSHISGCSRCMAFCDADVSCTSLECGEDQYLLDGTVKMAHCSWWRNRTCEKASEFTLNPPNYILTCTKRNKTGTKAILIATFWTVIYF